MMPLPSTWEKCLSIYKLQVTAIILSSFSTFMREELLLWNIVSVHLSELWLEASQTITHLVSTWDIIPKVHLQPSLTFLKRHLKLKEKFQIKKYFPNILRTRMQNCPRCIRYGHISDTNTMGIVECLCFWDLPTSVHIVGPRGDELDLDLLNVFLLGSHLLKKCTSVIPIRYVIISLDLMSPSLKLYYIFL